MVGPLVTVPAGAEVGVAPVAGAVVVAAEVLAVALVAEAERLGSGLAGVEMGGDALSLQALSKRLRVSSMAESRVRRKEKVFLSIIIKLPFYKTNHSSIG